MLQQPIVKFKRPRKPRVRRLPEDLPKFTVGLESKLMNLIGEPIALAQRLVSPKFKEEVSASDGSGTRYTYNLQQGFSYMNLEVPTAPFLWPAHADIFHTTIPRTTINYIFRVDLWADFDGKLKSFSFALQVS